MTPLPRPCPRSPQMNAEQHAAAHLVDWYHPITNAWTCFTLEAWVKMKTAKEQ